MAGEATPGARSGSNVLPAFQEDTSPQSAVQNPEGAALPSDEQSPKVIKLEIAAPTDQDLTRQEKLCEGDSSDSPHKEHVGDGIIPILHKKVFVTRHPFSNLY